MDDFGVVLRQWRQTRGYSQLELGLAAEVSTKHVSFLETGRAKPSREMVGLLASTLDIPLSERNMLLQSAGYREGYSCMALEQPEMEPVRRALTYALENHNPYPAIVMDQEWNMLMANEGYQKLLAQVVALRPNFPQTQNVLELFFDPEGVRPLVTNWADIASLLLQRVHRERVLYRHGKTDLLERLLGYPDIPDDWKKIDFSRSALPMTCLNLQLGDVVLEMFSSLSMFGTAIDINMQKIVIEQYFPVDDQTVDFFNR